MFRLIADSSTTFGAMQADIQRDIEKLILTSVLTEEYSRESLLDEHSRKKLASVAHDCSDTLQKLQELKEEFERWSTQSFKEDELANVLESLRVQCSALNTINECIAASTIDLSNKLQQYIKQVKSGDCVSSMMDRMTLHSMSTNDHAFWMELRSELLTFGIEPSQLEENRELVLRLLSTAFSATDPNLPTLECPVSDSDESDGSRRSGFRFRINGWEYPEDTEQPRDQSPARKVSRIRRLMILLGDKDKSLQRACLKGNLEAATTALMSGANIQAIDSEGRSTLELAMISRNASLVDFLLSMEVTHFDLVKALLFAVKSNKGWVIPKLLDRGVDIGSSEDDSPLAYAAACASTEVVKMLLENRANVNNNNFASPLIIAAVAKRPHLCQTLLDFGADIKVTQKERSVLHFAVESPDDGMQKWNVKANGLEFSSFSTRMMTCSSENLQILLNKPQLASRHTIPTLKVLLKAGADPNACEQRGATAMHMVAKTRLYSEYTKHKMLRILVRAGGNLSLKDKLGRTAQDLWTERGPFTFHLDARSNRWILIKPNPRKQGRRLQPGF